MVHPCKLPHRARPLAQWPARDRVAWTASATVAGWPKRYRQCIARAYGRFLAYAAPDQNDPALDQRTLRGFEAVCLHHLAPASAVSYLEALTYALLILRPEEDLSGLQAANQALRRRANGFPCRSPPGRRSRA